MKDTIKLLLSTLGIKDIVDILINAYILFRIYVLFYGTALFRALIGIVIIFILQRISVNIGLIMTSYILQGIITIGLFVLVIGFRHEFRGILQTKNPGDIFWRLRRKTINKSIFQDIIDAVFYLSEKKVGAIIVIPGKNNVEPFISGGIQIDSKINRELIESIFMSRGPLHDGALILHNDKIKKAGAILPLSKKEDIPIYYGTRHRAALGLSEVCDALIIVVSEETGGVSIAIGGEIFPIDDKKDLKLILDSHLGEITKKETGKEYLSYYTGALICLLVVSGVWFIFTRGQTSFSSVTVPVEIIKKSPELDIISTSPNNIKLTLSGPRMILRSIDKNDINLFIKIRDNKPGRYVYDITEKNLSLPPGIKIVKLTPERIIINLDKIITKKTPVQINWTGKLNKNILITDVKISPPEVVLIGPKTILEKTDTVYTDPVDVSNITRSGELNIRLHLNPSIKVKNEVYEVNIKFIVETRNQSYK